MASAAPAAAASTSRRSVPCGCKRSSRAEPSMQELIAHQLPGDPAGNHGDRVDQNISHYSEMAVAREMDSLGANVLVLPKSGHVAGRLRGRHAGRNDSRGVRHAIGDVQFGRDSTTSRPNCRCPSNPQEKSFTLTGILPKSEFQAKAAWGGGHLLFGRSAAGPRSV